jgi:hypothetical protein
VKGQRSVLIEEFYLVPGSTPQLETVLESGDSIAYLTLPKMPVGAKSVYLKLRDRAFALASAAIVMKQNTGGKIDFIRVAMGSVGTKPWRSVEAEKMLLGKPATASNFAAAEGAVQGAKPQSQNGFKVELAKRCLVHAMGHASQSAKERTMDRVTESKVIGVATPRIDGPLKVSGSAMYASDHHFSGLPYAWPFGATISNGTITRLDTGVAEKMAGVVAVYHRENIGKLYRVLPSTGFTMLIDEKRPR